MMFWDQNHQIARPKCFEAPRSRTAKPVFKKEGDDSSAAQKKRVKRRITRGRSGARLSFKVVLKPTQTMLWINIVPPEPHTHTPVLVSHQTQDYYNITVFKATQMVTNQTIEQTSVSLLLQSGSRLVHREQCAVDEDESIISRRS